MKRIARTIIRQRDLFISSMDWAKENCHDVPDGTVFLADNYHIARGRQGRTWNLYPGQLIATLVLKPEGDALDHLNMALTIGVAQALASYGVRIKWPNDFIVLGRKVGGILAEAVWQDGKVSSLVVGIAINGNNEFAPHDPLHDSAISLKAVEQDDVNLTELRSQLFSSLDNWYRRWRAGAMDTIFATWKGLLYGMGRKISVHRRNGTLVCGMMCDVDSDGSLLIVTDKMGKPLKIPFCLVDRVVS